MVRHFVFVGIAIVAGVHVVLAQQDAIKMRKDIMGENAKQWYGVVGRTVRGQLPYDQAKIDAAFASVAGSLPKFATLFPADSKPTTKADYDASPKVWEDKAGFDAKAANMTKLIADNRGKAKDTESLKAVFQTINQGCDSCHETYRIKNR
jgi:cytochrome c556